MDRINLGEEFNTQFKSFVEVEGNKKKMKKHKRMEVVTYNDLNGSDKLHDKDDESLAAREFDECDLLPIVGV